MRKCVLLALPVAAAFAAMSSPASAALVLVSPCSTSNISPTASACAGWYEGNLLNNGGTHVQDQIDALATLGYTWNGDWAAVDLTKVDAIGNLFDFAGTLSGDALIGIHKGNGGRNGFSGTAFFRLNDLNGLDSVALNLGGASSAVVYNPGPGAVPEPASWAMLLVGFGGIGFAMRRRKASESAARMRVAYI